MAKRKNAIFDRDKECDHPQGFPWNGRIPCTGRQVCPLCGEDISDVGLSYGIHSIEDVRWYATALLNPLNTSNREVILDSIHYHLTGESISRA